MTVDSMTVAGRRFGSKADYEAALRDQKKIDIIKSETDFESPRQIYDLFHELQSGMYRFETAVGTDFDDKIYEKVEELKAKGITSANAEQFENLKGKKGKRTPKKTKTAKKASTNNRKQQKTYRAEKKQNGKAIKLVDYDANMQKQILAELRKQEKRRKWIVTIASFVAAACFGYFGIYYFNSARTGAAYETLASLKGNDTLSDAVKGNDFSLHKTGIKMPDILDEYKTLYQKNKKLIGWLKIDDTIIDYPVMQTADNEYYLEHNFNQEYDKNGSIFLDYNCSVYPRSTNLILYGHHMKSGRMFGQLQRYAKESYGKAHPKIQFDSIYETGTYEVMYVFRSKVYNENDFVFKYYQFIDANSEEEFNSYMKEMAEMSLYDTGVTASYGDKLLTLSTCDNSQTDGRFAVVAKKIK